MLSCKETEKCVKLQEDLIRKIKEKLLENTQKI